MKQKLTSAFFPSLVAQTCSLPAFGQFRLAAPRLDIVDVNRAGFGFGLVFLAQTDKKDAPSCLADPVQRRMSKSKEVDPFSSAVSSTEVLGGTG